MSSFVRHNVARFEVSDGIIMVSRIHNFTRLSSLSSAQSLSKEWSDRSAHFIRAPTAAADDAVASKICPRYLYSATHLSGVKLGYAITKCKSGGVGAIS